MKEADPHRELFVLGLLRRMPLSAYAIDRVMRDHVPLYRRFSRGNVYQFVERLTERGLLLRRTAAASRGPHETKWIYRLSASGEARFSELLHRVIADVQSTDAALETALVLLGQLPRQDALALMHERVQQIESQERRLSRLLGDIRRRGGSAYFSTSHAVHRLRSERKFLQEAMALLRDRKWEPDWILNDGPVTDPGRKL